MNKNVEKVSINLNGAEMKVTNLSPQSERELAIVDLTVLQRLASYLPKADLYGIKNRLKNEISDVTDMAGFVALLEEELAFHKTVNLITTVTMTEETTSEETSPEPALSDSDLTA